MLWKSYLWLSKLPILTYSRSLQLGNVVLSVFCLLIPPLEGSLPPSSASPIPKEIGAKGFTLGLFTIQKEMADGNIFLNPKPNRFSSVLLFPERFFFSLQSCSLRIKHSNWKFMARERGKIIEDSQFLMQSFYFHRKDPEHCLEMVESSSLFVSGICRLGPLGATRPLSSYFLFW